MTRFLHQSVLIAAALVCNALNADYDYYKVVLDDGDKLTAEVDHAVLHFTAKDGEIIRVMLGTGSSPTRQHGYFMAYASPPAHLQVPLAYREIEIIIDNHSIVGAATLTNVANASHSVGLSLDLSVSGEWVSGTVEWGSVVYAAEGTVSKDNDLKTEQSFQTGALWPKMMGPNDSNAAIPHGQALLEDLEDYRLVWISEEFISSGPTPYWFRSHPAGGSAGPVVAGNMVYLSYYVPSGTANTNYNERQPSPAPWNLLDADDVVVAMDSRTGETVWKQVFPLRGYTWAPHKMEMQGGTPVIHEDTIYTIGSAGHLNALDLTTGAVKWTSRLPGTGFIDSGKEQIRNNPAGNHTVLISGRSGGHSLNYADGVVLVGNLDSGTALFGFNASTGALLWSRSSVMGVSATPTVWKHAGQEYVLVLDRVSSTNFFSSTLRCLDPQTGTNLWQHGGLGPIVRELLVHGDLVFLVTDGGSGIDTWGCYELTTSGLNLLWTLDSNLYGSLADITSKVPGGGALVVDGKAWLRTSRVGFAGVYIVIVDISTGLVEQEFLYEGSIQETTQYASDNLVFLPRDEQHGYTFPKTYNSNGDFLGTWWPTHPHTTGYQIPWTTPIVDGRIFFRGLDAIYAYELRQHPNGIPHVRFSISPDIVTAIESLADFTLAPAAMGATNQIFTFDATESIPGQDAIADYFWNFGDGNTASGAVVQHTFGVPDYYRVTITVSDTSGRSHQRSKIIGITDTAPAAPLDFQAQSGSQTEILLQWADLSDGELGFRLERKLPSEVDWDAIKVLPPGTTSWTDQGLQSNTAYQYRLVSFNEGFDSEFAGPLQAQTLDQVFMLFLEAECGENISNRWKVVENPDASNGQFLEVLLRDLNRPPHPDNVIDFPFVAPFTGNYKVWAYAFGLSGSNDSLHYAINDEWFYSFGFCCGKWDWWPVATYPGLPAGSHVMKIGLREISARFDKLLITTADAKPTILGPIGANCASEITVDAPMIQQLIFFGDELDIIFYGQSGVMYHLEHADDPAGPWSTVYLQETMGEDADIVFTGPINNSTGRKFFRVAATYTGP